MVRLNQLRKGVYFILNNPELYKRKYEVFKIIMRYKNTVHFIHCSSNEPNTQRDIDKHLHEISIIDAKIAKALYD